ncbi:hypothetical protein B0H19DRAFT_46737 [Mycena capillaripes]|nr:hypothetical protein B0H19DRAFT_46737 [Mycena capillaripes]
MIADSIQASHIYIAAGCPVHSKLLPLSILYSMSLLWQLEEIQAPVAGRKSSPRGSPRPMDPPPVVRLRCTAGGKYIDPRLIPGFNMRSLACAVDLFRLPEGPNPRMNWSYYAPDGTFDNEQPVYALFSTDYPDGFEMRIGNHLLLESSKETHLLQRQTVAQAYEIPGGDIIFAFPNMGVLQTGQYLLRYTVYNQKGSQLLTKCFGKRFTIYTADRFPGIQLATPLSQVGEWFFPYWTAGLINLLKLLAGLKIPGFGNKQQH